MADQIEDLALKPPGKRPVFVLVLLSGVLPLLIMASAIHARNAPSTVMLAAAAFMAAFAALMIVSLRRHRARFVGNRLEVASSFYKVVIESDDIASVQIVGEGDPDPRFALALRTNGITVPGFRAGWFRTKRRQKAFVATTGAPNLYVDTHRGMALLLTSEQPQRARERIAARIGALPSAAELVEGASLD